MNKIIQVLREGAKPKLVAAVGEALSVPPRTKALVDLDLGANKLLLKSIEVKSNKQTDLFVEFFEDSGRTDSHYNSGIVSARVYDILDLPYKDFNSQEKMYITISNESDYEASYQIEVRGTELK